MSMTTIVDAFCAIFVGITLARNYSKHTTLKSSRLLNLCLFVMLLTLIDDSMAYAFMGPAYPVFLRYSINLLSFLAASINAFAYSLYAEALFGEKGYSKPWLFRVLRTLVLIWFLATIYEFIAGHLVMYDANGVENLDYSIPTYINVLQMVFLVGMPIVTIMNRRRIGTRQTLLMCVFNIVPIFSSLIYSCLGIDCAYAFAAVTLVLVAEFAQKMQMDSLEKELALQKEREIEQKLLAEKEEKLQQDLLERMAGDDGVFLIDYVNDTRKTIHDRVHTSEEFSDAQGYSDNFKRYVEVYISESDRDMMREVSSVEYIRKRMKYENEFSVRYRETYSGEPLWFEMRTVRISDTTVMQSFKNIDKLVNSEIAQRVISEDFFGIYTADLNNDIIRVIKRSPAFRSDSTLNENSYSEIINTFVSGLNYPDKIKWQGLESADGVREFLSGQDKRELLYESTYRDGCLSRATWFVLERDRGEVSSVCLAFSHLDKEETDREKLNSMIADQKEQLQNAFNRNDALYRMIDGYKWSYEINADGEIIAAHYDEGIANRTNADNPTDTMAWVDNLHPDDRERVRSEFMATVQDKSGNTPYETVYRIISRDGEYIWAKTSGRLLPHNDGTAELFGMSVDITAQMEEQQKRLLGAVRISSDILEKENIGMWAFELDEGQPPRMYGDEAMLRLVGLDHQVPPEEMYHAWYDHIDEGSYDLVNDAVEKMMAGEHAEVQYPWYHPDGHTMMVRCGGVRNPEYSKGIRVEGTHQNVTEVLHFDDEERRMLEENNTRLFALEDDFMSLYDVELESGHYVSFDRDDFYSRNVSDNVVSQTEFFEDLRTNVNRVVYEDDREDVYNVQTREAIVSALSEKDHVDHFYRIITENGPMWLKMRIVYKNAEKKNIIIGIFNAEEEMAAMQREERFKQELLQTNARLFALEDNFESLYDVDMESGHYDVFVKGDFFKNTVQDKLSVPHDYFEELRANIDAVIYEEDRDGLYNTLTRESIRRELEDNYRFDYIYRINSEEGPVWLKIRIVYKDVEKKNIIIGVFNAEEEMAIKLKDEEYLKAKELELRHLEFRASALDYLVANEEDIASYLNFFAGRLRELIDCDQVIYRDANGTMLINNAPELGDEFRIPIDVCQNCNHYDIFDPIYKNGIAEMSDTRLGVDGVPVNPECPVKSSLTCIVTLNGKANGYLSIHYLLKHHEFSDYERQTLEEFTRLLSISLSRHIAKTENQQLTKELELKKQIEEQNEKLNNNMQLIGGLASGYNALYYINIDENSMHIYALDETKYPGSKDIFDNNEGDIYDNIRTYGLSDKVHPDDRHLFKEFGAEWIREKLKGRKKYGMRFRVVTDDGYRWDEMELTKYEEIGEMANAVAVGFADRDADIRRELEYQQKLEEARNDAETANRSKTNFLFNMSHDIRTPMNAITGFTNMAKKHIADKEKVADSLNKIESSGKQLLSLINQVLEMARIESGKVELDLKPINVSHEFDSAVTVLAEQARSKGLEFVYSTNGIKHNDVLADTARVSSITLNITGNAMKYTPRGGKIEYDLKEIAPRKEGFATFVFSVTDTGIGMSADYLKVLFEPFTREKNSTVSKIQGTGLGMSIVKDLVELMDGDIEVHSELGKGTRFDITLDFEIVEKVVSGDLADKGEFKVSFAGKRLLLVEDNELNREIAIDILDEEGLVVEEAEDGTVAVELLKENGPDYYDFILMDIQMPIMNGYEATKAIREMYPSAKLPIIALSANAFSEDKEKSLEAGMDEHVAKPIDIGELFKALMKFV